MPGRLPVTGHWPKPPDRAYHEDHEKHFGLAIQDALNTWREQIEGDNQEQELAALDVGVSLEATITPNPGGIKEYRATITFG